MSGVSGDFAGLGKLEANLRRLSEVPSRASTGASEKIAGLIADEFDSESDAYGRAWQGHADSTVARWGEHPILDLTGDMRGNVEVRPMAGAGVSITFEEDYAVYHHTGTPNMPARPVLPLETMPATWEAAMEEACSEAFDEVLGEVD